MFDNTVIIHFTYLEYMEPTTILVFNGLHFPMEAINTAVERAQTANTTLSTLFIVSDKDQSDGYPFPNDLEEAEEDTVSDSKVHGEDFAIIASAIRLLRREAASKSISLQTRVLASPAKATLHKYIGSADQVFLAENTIDPALLSFSREKLLTLLEGLSENLNWVA